MNTDNPKVLLGIGAAVAAVFAFVMYRKNTAAAATNAATDQLPAENAMANYTVPPTIGAQVDNTGGINYPNGTPPDTTVTLSSGAAQSLPMGT
jgi:hypothetical protein